MAPAAKDISSPGSTNSLNAVWCTSSTNCWSVGNDEDASTTATVNQAQHWNGTSWSTVSVPDPAPDADGNTDSLSSVTCTSSTNCWAVGASLVADFGVLTVALHYNGTSWTQVTTPNPEGTAAGDLNSLNDVSCTSSTNCWAVGGYGTSNEGVNSFSTLALHYNGTSWTQVTTPNPAGTATGDSNSILGVDCTSSTNCWGVGGYNVSGGATLTLAVQYNGTSWTQVATTSPGGTASNDTSELGRVSCASATSCFAVGGDGNTTTSPNTTTSLNLAEHWNGTSWSTSTTPDPSGTATNSFQNLQDVTCTSSSNCWAVGNYNNSNVSPQNDILHWTSGAWSQVSDPDPGGTAGGDFNHMTGVSCASSSACQAVGNEEPNGGAQDNEAQGWNGTSWSGE